MLPGLRRLLLLTCIGLKIHLQGSLDILKVGFLEAGQLVAQEVFFELLQLVDLLDVRLDHVGVLEGELLEVWVD